MAGRIGSTLQSGPAVTCMKMLLTIFNFIFWISGIAILALGIWMKVELHTYVELTQNYYPQTPYVLIGVGAGIVIIGSLGCICTVKGKSSLLYIFAVFLVIIFICELAVAIAAFVYKGKFQEGFQLGLGDAMKAYKDNEEKRKTVDGLQSGLHCCGSDGYADWFKIDWGTGVSDSVPTSCCVDDTKCSNTALPPASNGTLDVFTEGCNTKVNGFMGKNFSIIGGVAIGFSFLQLFGALLACGLAKNLNKAKYEQVA